MIRDQEDKLNTLTGMTSTRRNRDQVKTQKLGFAKEAFSSVEVLDAEETPTNFNTRNVKASTNVNSQNLLQHEYTETEVGRTEAGTQGQGGSRANFERAQVSDYIDQHSEEAQVIQINYTNGKQSMLQDIINRSLLELRHNTSNASIANE